MIRSFTLLMVLFSFFNITKAQNYWGRGAGGNNVDEALDITKDSSGNFISAGYFTNTALFDAGTTLVSATPGTPDVFVQKISTTGNLLWAVRAGGSGSDRATAVKTDANGDIYITGFYYGSANFGGITLNSVNGTQDIFIAKLSNTGIFQWAISAGGNKGDYSYGLALDPNNNVFITGEFEGAATFGTQTITSQTNPQTSQPSFDIFTAKYNSFGIFQWVQQGMAERNDRGMDLVCDSTGSVYVTGQFSDTITFQNTYNNNVTNAVFILKYNSAGQEVWFRKAAGNYGIGYSIALYNNQDLYVCGDYKGTMTFFGSPNHFLTDTRTNRIFLAKYTTSGAFVWAQSDASNNPLSARAIALSGTGDIYIAGEFGCVMNEYSVLYGTSNFNAVGYTDIFVCRYTSAGTRTWERHFGGPLRDKAHGIVEGNNGRPVIAGSFEKNISWPLGVSSMQAYSSYGIVSSMNNPYCSDADYGAYTVIKGSGLANAFVCDVIDIGRQPYDFYIRNGATCDRDPLAICISNGWYGTCSDTIKLCEPDTINFNLHQVLRTYASPLYHINWSGASSSDTNTYTYIPSSGYKSVKLTSYDGCYTFQDTVFVHVDTTVPTITDDHGVNFNHLPNAAHVYTCFPDSVLLTAGANSPGVYNYQWSGSSPVIISDTVINTVNSGLYHLNIYSANGCVKDNKVVINIIQHLVPYSVMPDTFEVCKGDKFNYTILDSTLSPAGSLGCSSCYCYTQHNWSISDTALHVAGINCDMITSFFPSTTGSYIITDTIQSIQPGCSETVVFTDTIYVIVNPLPALSISVSGQSLICRGDTSTIIATTISPVTWNTGATSDTIYATEGGLYLASVSFTDTITGCYNHKEAGLQVTLKQEPLLSTIPGSALICPNDSVQLEVDLFSASTYVWHGPMGIIQVNAQNVATNVPGLYHCTATDPQGCVLTSNTVEIKQYSTPYLVGQPVSVLCPGETTDVIVMTDETAIIQWQTPFSGDALAQTIDSGGVYTCSVTSCGITTDCEIEIIQAHPTAAYTVSGNTHFCPGDSVIFNADTSMAILSWTPTGYAEANYHVYYPGSYWLMATDQYGCSAFSDTVVVTWDTSVVAPVTSNDTICIGGAAVLIASIGTGPIEWYPAFPSSNLLSSNDTFIVTGLDSSAIYYVTTQNSVGCHSYWIPVHVEVFQSGFLPQITSDTIACAGAPIQLSTNTVSGASYQWNGPQGFSSTLQNPVIANANTGNVGVYSLIITGGGCSSLPAQVDLDLIQALSVTVSGTTILCEGDSLNLLVHSQHQPVSWYSVDSTNIVQPMPDSSFIAASLLPGQYMFRFYESYYGCTGPQSNVSVTIKPKPWLLSITNNLPLCSGDSLHLSSVSYTGANYFWNGPNSFTSHLNQLSFVNSDTSLNGIYTVSVELNGCMGDTVSIDVQIYPGPTVYLGNDTTVCTEDSYLLDAGANYSLYQWNNNTSEQTLPVDSSRIYAVTITNSFGCMASDSVYVSVITCNPTMSNIFTPNGDGINDVFRFPGDKFKEVECTITDRWGRTIHSWKGAEGFWDGTTMLKQPSEEGTYFYTGKLVDYRGKEFILKGFVQLSR